MSIDITRRGKALIATTALAGLVSGGVALGTAADAAPTASGVGTTHTIGKVAFDIGGVDDSHEVAILHGAITDGGRDDASHDAYDVLHLSKGSMRLNHPDSDSTFTSKLNPKTCYVTFTIRGRFTVNHGTGAYRGVTGSGTYRGHGVGIAKRTKAGACNLEAVPQVEIFTVSGTGTLSR